MSKGKTIGGIIMIVLGAILMALGFLIAAIFFATGSVAQNENMIDEKVQERIDSFKRNALETIGEITEIDRDAGTTKIGYQSETDNSYHELQIYTVLEDYSVGDAIVTYYNMDDPSDAMVPEIYELAGDMVGGIFVTIGAVAAGVGVVGLILLIAGIVLVVKSKKKNQEYNSSAGNFQNGQF